MTEETSRKTMRVDRFGWSPPRPPFMHRFQTRFTRQLRLFTALAIAAITAMVIMANVTYTRLSDTVENEYQRRQLVTAERARDRIISDLAGVVRLTEHLRPAAAAGGVGLAVWRQSLSTTAPRFLRRIGRVGPDGVLQKIYYGARLGLDEANTHAHPPTGPSRHYSAVCVKCLDGAASLTVFVPEVEGAAVTSYLAASVDLRQLYDERVLPLQTESDGYPWIIDEGGLLLGAPNGDDLGQTIFHDLPPKPVYERFQRFRARMDSTKTASGADWYLWPEGEEIRRRLVAFTVAPFLDKTIKTAVSSDVVGVTRILRSATLSMSGLGAALAATIISLCFWVLMTMVRGQAEERRHFEGSIVSLISAMEARDPYTRGHSENVAYYATCLGERMGVAAHRLERIYLGGLLHDLGKIGIRDHILNKPGKLNAEEYAHMKAHPCLGHQILSSLSFLDDVSPMVRHHHERMDGHGYPDGLSGDDIPLEARIVAVADVFDALTTDRPYRDGMSTDKALAILKDMAGHHLDSAVVTTFIKALPLFFDPRRRSVPTKEANAEAATAPYILDDQGPTTDGKAPPPEPPRPSQSV